ncbi:MAG: prepilin peptidase [Candidatus Omnitrophota bacterium]
MTQVTQQIIIFIFGLCAGSFLNVCIYRLPRAESIIMPGSHCPYCNNKIRFYDNIPLISYILLKGRCRDCNVKISFKYFFVELLTAVIFLFSFKYYGISLQFFIYNLFFVLLLIAAFVDMKYRIIPDEVSLGGIILGLALSFIFPQIQNVNSHFSGLLLSVIGALIGAAITYLTGLLGSFLFKKEAMGFGDVKLMAAVGAFLGWALALIAFFTAPFFGLIYGIFILVKKKSHLVPYGPFLSLGAVIALLFGKKILSFLVGVY